MRIAVVSGKGGTGKTTIATSLAWLLAEERPTQYLDCDVEEPNGHLFLKPTITAAESVKVMVPEVDTARCIHCGACSQLCQFNAIAAGPAITLVFPQLCHSCGGCVAICPAGALKEVPRTIGTIATGQVGALFFGQGVLNIGEALSPPVIRALKQKIIPGALVILDGPPGTSCPAMTAVRQSDYALLVAEPTPFGEHDFQLAVEMVRELDLPFGVVINRAEMGDQRVAETCQREGIPVLARIPYDAEVARVTSDGGKAVESVAAFRKQIGQLTQRLQAEVTKR